MLARMQAFEVGDPILTADDCLAIHQEAGGTQLPGGMHDPGIALRPVKAATGE
jgi:hypothetical protein